MLHHYFHPFLIFVKKKTFDATYVQSFHNDHSRSQCEAQKSYKHNGRDRLNHFKRYNSDRVLLKFTRNFFFFFSCCVYPFGGASKSDTGIYLHRFLLLIHTSSKTKMLLHIIDKINKTRPIHITQTLVHAHTFKTICAE